VTKTDNNLQYKAGKKFQENRSKKQGGVAILISNKIDFQPKVVKKGEERHFILAKRKIYQDELSILNIYAPNAKAPTLQEILLELKCKVTH
jgi:exonuclease III